MYFPDQILTTLRSIVYEAGMDYCARWLNNFINEVPITFIPAETHSGRLNEQKPYYQILTPNVK